MKLSEKTKKYLAISGGAVICVGLIAAISLQFNKTPAGEDTLPEKNPGGAEIVVDPSSLATSPEELVTEETNVIVQPNTETAEPSEEVKKDATQKPDGTKVETPPAPVAHESVVPPAEPEPEPDQPQGGEIQDGKVYLPGFGWVTDTGSSGTTADDMYENGNKIGDMGN